MGEAATGNGDCGEYDRVVQRCSDSLGVRIHHNA
jgi:hypothetical protein